MTDKKYRLITRSDFDGLVCALLLKELNLIDDVYFVHPKDMQDGIIPIDDGDISTNLPYVPGVHLAFDHHYSETLRFNKMENHIIDPGALSAAQVVYDYYGGKTVFGHIPDDIMQAVNKGDSANFSHQEILNPSGWVLMNFIMDSRTGLGRFHHFKISNYQLMMKLIDFCRNHSIEEILELPDVQERVDLYFEHQEKAIEQIKKNTKTYGYNDEVVVLNLKNDDVVYCTNRFLIYSLFPKAQISIHLMWGRQKQNVILAIGKSILNKTSMFNIGEACLKYDGGGHSNAGSCQVSNQQYKTVLNEIIYKIIHDE